MNHRSHSSSLRLAALSLLGAVLAPALASQAQAPAALDGYRTVETAITSQASAAPASVTGLVPYLGISVEPDRKNRLTVVGLSPESPAAKAGVLTSDILLRFAGDEMKSAEELRNAILARQPGEAVELQVTRVGKKLKLNATLGILSRPYRLSEQRAVMGVTLGDPKDGGTAIQAVTDAGPAAQAGLKPGDVLLRVDEAPVASSQRLADTLAQRVPGETVKLRVKREALELEIALKLGQDANPDARRIPENSGGNIWKKESYRLAIIGIEYPDAKHNPQAPAEAWEEAMFSRNSYVNKNSATGQPVFGSMNDYYHELSCGGFKIEGKAFPWIEVEKKRNDYNLGSGTGANGRALLTDALNALVKRDGANALEGYDGIIFLYAGDRVQTTRGGVYWPHRSNVTFGGKRWPYFICPEGGPRMTNISVFCHEFGHMLGLPDLYARPENPGSEGLGTWCAMSNQLGNGRPQHMSAWCKEQLGWLKPVVIDPTVKQKLVLAPIEGSNKECFKVLVRKDGSEYFLLENRRKKGWDADLSSEGLLIWRVVGGRPILTESHGVDGPAGPGIFLTAVPYPSNANTSFTPYTTPGSRSQLGGGMPVWITNIQQQPDGRVSFQVGYEFQ